MPTKSLREYKTNSILNTGLDATLNDRYCTHCHIKLIHNPRNSPYDKYLYTCPRCNCGNVNIHNTEPSEKLVVTFPTLDPTSLQNRTKNVLQADSQRLSRSQYFIQKNVQERNKLEIQDPYLAILKKNNKITITNIDYSDPTEYEY